MNNLIVVRGGGDIATGTIHRLHRTGFKVLVLECPNPSAIRRRVAFCEAVFDGSAEIEGVVCQKADSFQEVIEIINGGKVALMVDENGAVLKEAAPLVVVDAILAKRNLGTNRAMAKFTVALGPGFVAGSDVDCVIETMRGHRLGRLIYNGAAMENTGVPGLIKGIGAERVIHAAAAGRIKLLHDIGDIVAKGEVLAVLGDVAVKASISGVLRGIIREGYPVTDGLKIADIDPRETEQQNCFTISDKARCISGGVLEAIMHFQSQQ